MHIHKNTRTRITIRQHPAMYISARARTRASKVPKYEEKQYQKGALTCSVRNHTRRRFRRRTRSLWCASASNLRATSRDEYGKCICRMVAHTGNAYEYRAHAQRAVDWVLGLAHGEELAARAVEAQRAVRLRKQFLNFLRAVPAQPYGICICPTGGPFGTCICPNGQPSATCARQTGMHIGIRTCAAARRGPSCCTRAQSRPARGAARRRRPRRRGPRAGRRTCPRPWTSRRSRPACPRAA